MEDVEIRFVIRGEEYRRCLLSHDILSGTAWDFRSGSKSDYWIEIEY